jgi:hypothetical protein
MRTSLILFLFGIIFFTGCSKDKPASDPNQFSIDCTGITQSGSVIVGKGITNKTSLSISVNVAKTGVYSISTDTLNGIYFSSSDTFNTTGTQTVVLKGTGTPVSLGTNKFTIRGDGDSCKVDVTAVSPGSLSCKLNGVYYDFSRSMTNSLVYNTGVNLKVFGYQVPSGNYNFTVWIQHSAFKPLVPGTYSINSPGFYVKGQYTDPVFNYWIGDPGNAGQPNPFTVVITGASATEVTGTFSGRIREKAGFGPAFKDVTEGQFRIAL